jgi:predicted small secreted protein
MRRLIIPLLLAGSAALAGCNTVEGVGEDIQSAANALDPNATYPACGSYGMMDRDNNGYVSQAEWNAYRTGAYGAWDMNGDGRISRNEFGSCWYGGGFYNDYDRTAWDHYWTSFDANRDGYLSANEYYSAAAWARMDRNRNGRIDSDEWRWW